MPINGKYNDSAPAGNPKNEWQQIGDLAAQLKRKVEIQIGEGNAEAAETYHAMLVELEAGK